MPADPAVATTQEISDQIFGPYLLPFWALSFVLLAAVVGAIVLARRD
jgi:NADH-quinone oxidoreductase subunit J